MTSIPFSELLDEFESLIESCTLLSAYRAESLSVSPDRGFPCAIGNRLFEMMKTLGYEDTKNSLHVIERLVIARARLNELNLGRAIPIVEGLDLLIKKILSVVEWQVTYLSRFGDACYTLTDIRAGPLSPGLTSGLCPSYPADSTLTSATISP